MLACVPLAWSSGLNIVNGKTAAAHTHTHTHLQVFALCVRPSESLRSCWAACRRRRWKENEAHCSSCWSLTECVWTCLLPLSAARYDTRRKARTISWLVQSESSQFWGKKKVSGCTTQQRVLCGDATFSKRCSVLGRCFSVYEALAPSECKMLNNMFFCTPVNCPLPCMEELFFLYLLFFG